MEIVKESIATINLSGDKEINIFCNIIEKTFAKNREMGFNRYKLNAEESEFLEQIYQIIRR